jgi:signal transduction histidine kinase
MRLQLLRRRAEQEARAADVRELDLVQRGVGRLSALISNLLDVARLDQGVLRLDLQPLDLVALVREVARTLSTPEVPVQVRPYEEVLVLGDAERLRQCLENLLSNAVRHSPRGAEVVVTLRREGQQQDEVARVEVVDQGPGIPPELVGRLFERFVRGAGASEGLGLGLHLARSFARAHGGDLTVDSSPGRGARFVLTVRAQGSDE